MYGSTSNRAGKVCPDFEGRVVTPLLRISILRISRGLILGWGSIGNILGSKVRRVGCHISYNILTRGALLWCSRSPRPSSVIRREMAGSKGWLGGGCYECASSLEFLYWYHLSASSPDGAPLVFGGGCRVEAIGWASIIVGSLSNYCS